MAHISNENARDFIPLQLNVPFELVPSEKGRLADPVLNKVYDDSVRYYMKCRVAHLTGRQVPSCLLVTNLGSRIAMRDVEDLLEMGFPLEYVHPSGLVEPVPVREPSHSAISKSQLTWFTDLMESIDRENNTVPSEILEEDDDDFSVYTEEPRPTETGGFYRFVYQDPFVINAALEMDSLAGSKEPIKVINWPGGVIRLTDRIPKLCLTKHGMEGTLKRGYPLFKVSDPDIQMNVLMRHTHWGKTLMRMCNPENSDEHRNFGIKLRKRIKSFLHGKADPLWSRDKTEQVYGKAYKVREPKKRSLRFLQMLQTIDGLFTQVYLCDMTAGWNWTLYDQFVLGHIHRLLMDEFLDGELEENFPMTYTTAYEALKGFRGQMKKEFLSEKPISVGEGITLVFRGASETLNATQDRIRKTQIGSILIQTRGCGTPPPYVVLKSKMKFIMTVAEEHPPVEDGQVTLVRLLVQDVLDNIPDHIFTGLSTKAGVSVTTSACMENLRNEGGSTEHIRTLVREGQLGRPVRIMDLNTGKVESTKKLSEISTGTYIFWRCLEEVLGTPPEILKQAQLVMIKEPGKARTVTKAHAALKVVLDLVNGICSYPLKKGVETSASGMGMAHHGWNFFTAIYTKWREVAFKVSEVRHLRNGPDSHYVEIRYEDFFLGFTDYSEATDRIDHKVAIPVAELWMLKCGIPKLLRGIVHETCFKPRTIFFDGTGPLKGIGTLVEEGKTLRQVSLRKGVLMGDPLTKVVLHLLNICARNTGRLVQSNSALKAHPRVVEYIDSMRGLISESVSLFEML